MIEVELPEEGIDLKHVTDEIERQFIGQALARTHHNKAQAANLLKLQRTTLIEKLRKHGFPLNQPSRPPIEEKLDL